MGSGPLTNEGYDLQEERPFPWQSWRKVFWGDGKVKGKALG